MNGNDSIPQRALVVTAHPDDVDFGVAGTVALWTAAGAEVTYCIVTDGAAGGSDPTVSRSDMATLRESEQRAAAKKVGVTDVRFLGYPDGYLEVSIALRRDICRVIRQVRPDRLVCQSPERWWERIQASHPDHLAAGEACIQAMYPDAQNPFAHPDLFEKEGLEPWSVPELWVMASPRTDTFVDVSASVDAKIDALWCHQSQISDPKALDAMVRGWLTMIARSNGLPDGSYAEAFHVVRLAPLAPPADS